MFYAHAPYTDEMASSSISVGLASRGRKLGTALSTEFFSSERTLTDESRLRRLLNRQLQHQQQDEFGARQAAIIGES